METIKNEKINEDNKELTTREQMYASLRENIIRCVNDLEYLDMSLAFFNCQLIGIEMEEKGILGFKENMQYGKILRKLDKLQKKLIYKNTHIGDFENMVSKEISRKKFCDEKDSKEFEKALRNAVSDFIFTDDLKVEDYKKSLDEMTEELYDINVASEYSNFLESIKNNKDKLFKNENLYKELLDHKKKDVEETKNLTAKVLKIKDYIDNDRTISNDEHKLLIDIYYKAINLTYRLLLIKVRDVRIINFGLTQKELNLKLNENQDR